MAQCLKTWVKLDSNFAPIPGTMQQNNPLVTNPTCKTTLGCQYVILQNTSYTTPEGMIPCQFPDGMRYFYQINYRTGQIVPNSLRQSLVFPTDSNSCQWIEYRKFCNV